MRGAERGQDADGRRPKLHGEMVSTRRNLHIFPGSGCPGFRAGCENQLPSLSCRPEVTDEVINMLANPRSGPELRQNAQFPEPITKVSSGPVAAEFSPVCRPVALPPVQAGGGVQPCVGPADPRTHRHGRGGKAGAIPVPYARAGRTGPTAHLLSEAAGCAENRRPSVHEKQPGRWRACLPSGPGANARCRRHGRRGAPG